MKKYHNFFETLINEPIKDVLNNMEYINTTEFQGRIRAITVKLFLNKPIKKVLDLTDMLDLFTFKMMVSIKKEFPLINSLGLNTLNELTEEQRNNCAIDLYLELKKKKKIK